MTSRKSTLLYTLIILLLGAGLTACGDNPVVHDDDDEEHAEADGLRVVHDGVEVYRVLDGQVSCQEEPCGIDVVAGEDTGPITVEFLDADGDQIHEEDLEEDFTLGFEIADPAIAAFEQNDQEGKWSFHLIGEQVGETKMRLHLQHLDEHPDFSTPPLDKSNALTIRVTED